MPRDFIAERRAEFEKTVQHLREEIGAIRTGRASPAIVEGIQVEAYGSHQALVGLASISTPDARTISIEPWDKSIVKAIEKGIIEAGLGLNPVVAGTVIRVPLPPLTEESRLKLVKLLGDKLEHARIGIRKVRDDARQDIMESEKAKEITEDEKYRMLEDLDKTAANWNEKIKTIGEGKEKEIMTV